VLLRECQTYFFLDSGGTTFHRTFLTHFSSVLFSYFFSSETDEFLIRPKTRRLDILKFLKEEKLRDLSLSRNNFTWGIPIPGSDDHVMYVWFDALTNYGSAVNFLDQNPGKAFSLWCLCFVVVWISHFFLNFFFKFFLFSFFFSLSPHPPSKLQTRIHLQNFGLQIFILLAKT
jgi:hypothetical protein